MYEVTADETGKKIFQSRAKRSTLSRFDMKEVRANMPLLQKLEYHLVNSKKFMELRFHSKNSQHLTDPLKTESMLLVGRKTFQNFPELRYLNNYDVKASRADECNQLMQIHGLQADPSRYRSLLSTRHLHSKSSVGDDRMTNKQHTFILMSNNNNEQLVREILNTRKDWRQIKRGQGIPTLKWLAGDYPPQIFLKLKSRHTKRILNQFECHWQITTKNGLLRNLQIFTETNKIELFSMTPITFHIDFEDEFCQYNLRQFVSFFIKHSPKQTSKNNLQHKINSFAQKLRGYMSIRGSQLKKKVNPLSKPILYPEYVQGDNYIWLIKPTGLNRGRGIELFSTLEQLQKHFVSFLEQAGRRKTMEGSSLSPKKEKKQPQKESDEPEDSKRPSVAQAYTLKSFSFVIQKYIEKPLLINNRKFDIRIWTLLNNDMTVYFFKQGYLRLSSQAYSMDKSNYFIHLTNNAVQKYSKQYGAFQDGNQMSFASFSRHLSELEQPTKFQQILDKIKQISYEALSSVRTKINPHQRNFCFQLFGFDYIVDESYKVWLIEVNNNPCIECSSNILKQYIPRMLNDAFRLTIDRVFQREDQETYYSMEGYPDKMNLWERLGRLEPNCIYKPSSS